eukprot:3796079-Alexandrium_andersonii.AAC.1
MRGSRADGCMQVALRNVLVAPVPDLMWEMVRGMSGAGRAQYPPERGVSALPDAMSSACRR